MVSAAECPDFHVAAAFRAGCVGKIIACPAELEPRMIFIIGTALGRGKEFPRPFYVVQYFLAVCHFRQQASVADLWLGHIRHITHPYLMNDQKRTVNAATDEAGIFAVKPKWAALPPTGGTTTRPGF